eukprot:TRINITY_DN6214_c0_g1_i7.p1 TRINITY_DN6214_c0_g1~~TRINITY_DN6214_c0_g1_i7.p1  ORF type:complete len:302 (-),score=60.95 TRINITY_DN6214_c0_g1_i7:70-939(-)
MPAAKTGTKATPAANTGTKATPAAKTGTKATPAAKGGTKAPPGPKKAAEAKPAANTAPQAKVFLGKSKNPIALAFREKLRRQAYDSPPSLHGCHMFLFTNCKVQPRAPVRKWFLYTTGANSRNIRSQESCRLRSEQVKHSCNVTDLLYMYNPKGASDGMTVVGCYVFLPKLCIAMPEIPPKKWVVDLNGMAKDNITDSEDCHEHIKEVERTCNFTKGVQTFWQGQEKFTVDFHKPVGNARKQLDKQQMLMDYEDKELEKTALKEMKKKKKASGGSEVQTHAGSTADSSC